MNFTFGIITYRGDIEPIISSIRALNIPEDKYEIIVVGECYFPESDDVKKIHFDESVKSMWITKKKNLIIENAKMENIVFLHDYVVFDKDWYSGYMEFGNEWDVCCNKQITLSNERFRDWVLMDSTFDNFTINFQEKLIPYDQESAPFVYINGTYWVAKREFMRRYPLDENLIWGQSEDMIWSKQIKKAGAIIKMNTLSTNRLLNDKDVVFTPMCPVFYEEKYKPFIMDANRREKFFNDTYFGSHQHYFEK